MVYAGIMAHGTSLTAVECARMIPQLSATSIRQAMRWARDERRLSQACQAVLEFMQRHPIAATWGRSDLASRSEEHTSELQSLMRISYAVFCLKKKKRPSANHSNKSKKQMIISRLTKTTQTKQHKKT